MAEVFKTSMIRVPKLDNSMFLLSIQKLTTDISSRILGKHNFTSLWMWMYCFIDLLAFTYTLNDFYLDTQVWLKQACSSKWQRWLILEQQMEKSTRDYLTSSNYKQTFTKMYSASFHLSTSRIIVPYQKIQWIWQVLETSD